jgi:hypothetical protein
MSLHKRLKKIIEQLKNADEQGLKGNLTNLLAHLPYQIRVKNEKYYHSIFCLERLALTYRLKNICCLKTRRLC